MLNARAFNEHAERLLSVCRRYQHAVSIAYIDLDNFKAVNDTEGHLAGDNVLRQVGETLRASVRDADIVARLGGDEFVVLMPQTSAEGAERLLERLRSAVATALADLAPSVGMSVGAICFQTTPPDVHALVAPADAVMYQAKAAGKNRVIVESR